MRGSPGTRSVGVVGVLCTQRSIFCTVSLQVTTKVSNDLTSRYRGISVKVCFETQKRDVKRRNRCLTLYVVLLWHAVFKGVDLKDCMYGLVQTVCLAWGILVRVICRVF